MKVARPGVCCALDPLASPSARGVPIHRHCRLPAGHDGMCESWDGAGRIVHRWEWHDTDDV